MRPVFLYIGRKHIFFVLSVSNIPNEPKIPLPNYLLDLIEDSDVKERSLYLNGVGPFIQNLWDDILPKRREGKSIRCRLHRFLDVSSIYPYKNDRKPMSIGMLYTMLIFWKKCQKQTKVSMLRKWDEFFEWDKWTLPTHSKHQKTKLPKSITPNLAYLIGWIIGDGHLKESHNYLVKVSEKSEEQLNSIIKPLFKELFSIHVPIFRKYGGGYAVQVGSKPVFRFFKNALKLQVGTVPEIVWHFDVENKKHFLMGVFDSEGYVNSTYRNRAITISQASWNFLNSIRELSSQVGVAFNTPVRHVSKLGTWYTIRIRRNELLNFYSVIGSYHVEKRKKTTIVGGRN